jgi:hypothetical protein
MKKETLQGIIGVTILVLVGVGAYFLVSFGTKKVVEKVDNTKVTEVMRGSFVESCVSDTATYAYCSCAYDKLINAWGVDKFVNESIKMLDTGELPDGTIGIIGECLSLIK